MDVESKSAVDLSRRNIASQTELTCRHVGLLKRYLVQTG